MDRRCPHCGRKWDMDDHRAWMCGKCHEKGHKNAPSSCPICQRKIRIVNKQGWSPQMYAALALAVVAGVSFADEPLQNVKPIPDASMFDGICAAIHTLARALMRESIDVHVSFTYHFDTSNLVAIGMLCVTALLLFGKRRTA